MDEADPPVTGVDLAKACGVTPQAVSGWRLNGRLHKRHLAKISEVTGRPLGYFLGTDDSPSKVVFPAEADFVTLVQAWKESGKTGREALLGLAKALRRASAKTNKKG